MYKKAGKPEVRYYLQTIIQVVKDPKPCYGSGAIGIDINVDHLAVGIIDRFGNPIETFSVPFRPYEASRITLYHNSCTWVFGSFLM
ncbi:MAG: hypothetical protein ACOH5I_13465 [Oligoflexus sp.]